MMTRLRAGGYRRRGAAGVAFIYFSLIGLPVMFFGAGLATDFTRIIVASRQVSNATQASALSGALQFIDDRESIDPVNGVLEANRTYCMAQDAGQMKLSRATDDATGRCTDGSAVSIEVTPVITGYHNGAPMYGEITVTAHYEVTGLVFTRLFGQGNSFEPRPITRTASICVPTNSSGSTFGNCVRPYAD